MMEKFMERGIIRQRGITLIALVITIIVLLILAGVTIAALSGDNGILTRAAESKNKTEEAQEKEGLKLAVTSSQMEDVNTLEIDKEKLENAIRQQFGNNKDFSVTDNKDGSFLVSMNDTGRMYYIDDTGEVIDQSKILKISTADELKSFRDNVNIGKTYEGWYVYLANNITLDINEEWEPIGYYSQDTTSVKEVLQNKNNRPFSGIFDGMEHIIDNLYINTSDEVQGIFGLVIDGKIKNIMLGENSKVSMTGGSSGGIVGYMYGTGAIINCKNYANIEQTSGGIVGRVAGSITVSNCLNYGELKDAIGGIVGTSNGTDWEDFVNVSNIISNCANYGNIFSASGNFRGGIVGFFKGDIFNSFNLGNVTAKGIDVGGISGEIYGNIENCYNIADVSTSQGNVGGLTGALTGNIINSYSIANITGNYSKGPFCGYKFTGTVENCYSKNDEFNASSLGKAFKEDANDINNGYPILQWQ